MIEKTTKMEKLNWHLSDPGLISFFDVWWNLGSWGGIIFIWLPIFQGFYVVKKQFWCAPVSAGHSDIVPHGSLVLSRLFTRQQYDSGFHFSWARHMLALSALNKGYQMCYLISPDRTTYCLGTRHITDRNMSETWLSNPLAGSLLISYLLIWSNKKVGI